MASGEDRVRLPDLSGLSEEERLQLMSVMKKAQEFEVNEEKQLMRQPLEGLLYKYTNVMKGWQYRWFVLSPDEGRLEYYEKEEHKKSLRARGYLMLANASICPSDEDSQTFYVNASNGDCFRLKAYDAKERQHWVNRLRATAEYHSELAGNNLLSSAPLHTSLQRVHTTPARRTDMVDGLLHGTTSLFQSKRRPAKTTSSQADFTADNTSHVDASLRTCMDSLSAVRRLHKDLANHIEALPESGEVLCCLDKEVLVLKATSSATLSCLEQCLALLQRQMTYPAVNGSVHPIVVDNSLQLPVASTATVAADEVDGGPVKTLRHDGQAQMNVDHSPLSRVRHSDEQEDSELYSDTDLLGFDEHKSVILHLLSQLKLGMDLTKVVLPTFILEKRSLLETFADCMAHPQLFLRIPRATTAEARMLSVVKWYLLSFHAGRQGSMARKPYNPIIGEHFHCSWRLKNTDICSTDCNLSSSSSSSSASAAESSHDVHLYFCAEQVSHHPPVSAFYFESPEVQMSMSASIWTRSKFMGMSIGVALIGKVRLQLLSPAGSHITEEYEFSLPSVYARSILTVPWVELGDRITVQCEQTGLSAAIVFHPKPFYGGRVHRVSGEVKNGVGEVLQRISGEWNGCLEFSNVQGDTVSVDTSTLPIYKKRVRPIDMQDSMESRRLWRHVTDSLRHDDIDKATEHKRILEDAQREGEKVRKASKLPFPTKFFHRVDDEWLFNTPLQVGQCSPSV